MKLRSAAGRRTHRLMPLVVVVCLAAAGGAAAADRPALVDAARNADAAALRTLLDRGARVDEAEADGTTALHWASYRDHIEGADLLLRAGANVNASNDLGATALWMASQNGSTAMVGRLLAAGANPNAALLRGETPLMVAARSGAAEVAARLLAGGAEVNHRAARGQTALMWAVSQQHADVVEVLIAHGADIRARSDAWSQMMAVPPHGLPEYNREVPHGGNTALMFAARVGDAASARLLVEAGADVNDADAWGVSAMVLAAHSGYVELVEYLLDKGADANADAAGFSALHIAVMRRDERLATALLAHRANPNAPLRVWTPTRRSSADFNFAPALVGATPFWLAARFSAPRLMRLLAERGADPRFVHRVDYVADGAGPRREATTALMAAAGMGGGRMRAWVPPDGDELDRSILEAVKLAVELGVDVNAADIDGRTALDGAEALKHEALVAFLVARGAKPGPKKEK